MHVREVHDRQRKELAGTRLQQRWAQAMDQRTQEREARRSVGGGGGERRASLGTRMVQRLHSVSIRAWEAVQGVMRWIWEKDKANECSARTRRERAEQDDADTGAGANTWNGADMGGVGGGIAGGRSDGDGERGARCPQHSTQGKHTQHTVRA